MSRRDDISPPATPAEREKSAREARLASALRANLRRRKASTGSAAASDSVTPEAMATDD